MKKSNNVINVQLSDNQGKLHIRIAGWYIPKDFNDLLMARRQSVVSSI